MIVQSRIRSIRACVGHDVVNAEELPMVSSVHPTNGDMVIHSELQHELVHVALGGCLHASYELALSQWMLAPYVVCLSEDLVWMHSVYQRTPNGSTPFIHRRTSYGCTLFIGGPPMDAQAHDIARHKTCPLLGPVTLSDMSPLLGPVTSNTSPLLGPVTSDMSPLRDVQYVSTARTSDVQYVSTGC